MTSAKHFFGKNIRFLRERRKLTQEDLAQNLSITRVKLGAIEAGRTENPASNDLLQFSDFFKMSIDTLFRVDLSKLSELKIRELEAGNDIYMTGSNLRVLAVSVDKSNKENIEYVPIKAKAGYRDGYADPDFIASLPKFTLPTLPQTGTFRMFPTIGDSMLPIPEGADVICEFIEDWTSIKPGTLCVLALKGEQDFVFKKVTIKSSVKAALLESLNQDYLPYEVAVGEIVEIWKFQSYVSTQIPESVSDMLHLSITMNSVLQRLKVIEEKAFS
ncbi:helix-turn-helix domain-containing protein [Dyadobacter sp. CY261]|uniref:XRE family transcriptional regulator n=1 Tax=Dyadobacter sp. CY261 TaxID=2907203 RepID=UPI001F2C9C86|nr:helix-turn-helix domain-containing protein [Dyadobacter sp. CY261]MCF0072474.1 helix-turn-helix domain-containing protein [Dyadobacter sp. CY261]